MTKVFTKNDLVRYIYCETSKKENAFIETLLATDDEFYQSYLQLLEAKESVEGYQEYPDKQIIENILAYSKTSSRAENMQSIS